MGNWLSYQTHPLHSFSQFNDTFCRFDTNDDGQHVTSFGFHSHNMMQDCNGIYGITTTGVYYNT